MDYSEFVFFLPPQNSEKLESPQEISTLKGYEIAQWLKRIYQKNN